MKKLINTFQPGSSELILVVAGEASSRFRANYGPGGTTKTMLTLSEPIVLGY